MKTKKYWKQFANDRMRERAEAIEEADMLRQSLRFLLEDSDTYRVKLTPIKQVTNEALQFRHATRFEYVDQNGKYHRHCRPVSIDALEVISTNAETAIIKFETTKNRYTYWILNRVSETIAEIPEEYICTCAFGGK